MNETIIKKLKEDINIIKKEDNEQLFNEQMKSLRKEDEINKILQYSNSAKELIKYFCKNLDIQPTENSELNLKNIYKKINENENNEKYNYYYKILSQKKDGLSFLEYLLELIKRGEKYSKTTEETIDSEKKKQKYNIFILRNQRN